MTYYPILIYVILAGPQFFGTEDVVVVVVVGVGVDILPATDRKRCRWISNTRNGTQWETRFQGSGNPAHTESEVAIAPPARDYIPAFCWELVAAVAKTPFINHVLRGYKWGELAESI